MKRYTYLFFLSICISLNAQTTSKNEAQEADSTFLCELTGETYVEFRGYNGSQYFNDDWAESNILTSTGEMLYGKKLKYNGLLDEVIWLNTDIPRSYKLDRALINDIWFQNIQDKPIHFKRIMIDEPNKSHKSDIFAEVAVEGKISLYIQRKISVLNIQTIKKEGKLYPYKTIGGTPVYFIKLSSDKYFSMSRLNRSSLCKLFPNKKKDIVKLQKQNQINLNTESGLCEMIDSLNKEI